MHDLDVVAEVESQQDLVNYVTNLFLVEGLHELWVLHAACQTTTFHHLHNDVVVLPVLQQFVDARNVRM